jgi:SAM-dependent methyltransferase
MKYSPITAVDIASMHYSQLVGLVRERNRPSGGIRTVQTVAVNALLDRTSRVLEIGSNTGFTSVNLALLAHCRVTGIDVNPDSVAEATEFARANHVAERVAFQLADTKGLPFADSSFDLVWASNVTSFIDDQTRAVAEYLRVLANGGVLAFVPIYYRKRPPPNLVEQVGVAINAKLRTWTKEEWLSLCRETALRERTALELVFERDYEYLDRAAELDSYCSMVLSKPHLQALPADAMAVLAARYREMMALFNTNLLYCGYSVLLFQKRTVADEPELFLAREAPC